MSRFNAGDRVYATHDLHNDPVEDSEESAIPGLLPGMLLAAAGTRGMVVKVGYAEAMPGEEIYPVSFATGPGSALSEPFGCLPEVLTYGAGAP